MVNPLSSIAKDWDVIKQVYFCLLWFSEFESVYAHSTTITLETCTRLPCVPMVADCLICLHREFHLFSLFYLYIIWTYDTMNQNVEDQVSLTFWEVEKWVTRNMALWDDHGLLSYLVLLLAFNNRSPLGSRHMLMQYFNSVNVSLCLIAPCLAESREH